jgi:hypothetical protein
MGNGGGNGGFGSGLAAPATRPGLGARRRAPLIHIIATAQLLSISTYDSFALAQRRSGASRERWIRPSWTQPLSLDLGQNGEIAFLLWSWTSFSSSARRTGPSADVRPGREALREYSGGTPCRSFKYGHRSHCSAFHAGNRPPQPGREAAKQSAAYRAAGDNLLFSCADTLICMRRSDISSAGLVRLSINRRMASIRLLAALLLVAGQLHSAAAHGAMLKPLSRQMLIYSNGGVNNAHDMGRAGGERGAGGGYRRCNKPRPALPPLKSHPVHLTLGCPPGSHRAARRQPWQCPDVA